MLLRCPSDGLLHVWAHFKHQAGFFDGVDALVDAVRELAGRSNIWIGVNPVNRDVLNLGWAPHNKMQSCRYRARSEHIHSVRNLLLDLDPATPERARAASRHRNAFGRSEASATDAERQRALHVARHIITAEKLCGTLFCSGNGAQVLVPLKLKGRAGEIADWENWADLLDQYTDSVRSRYAEALRDAQCKLDNTADLPRIMCLAGVLKLKGSHTKMRSHEAAAIVEVFGEPRLVEDVESDPNPALVTHLLESFTLRPSTRRTSRRPSCSRPRGERLQAVSKPSFSRLPDEPFDCAMWNRFYREAPLAGRHRRSGTLSALARKLVADGRLCHQHIRQRR